MIQEEEIPRNIVEVITDLNKAKNKIIVDGGELTEEITTQKGIR